MRRLRVTVLAALLAVLVIGSGCLLVIWAMVGASRAETARHKEVSQRVVDAMEAELSDLVAREERRSFLEYRAYYLPEQNAQLGNVVRSPLSEDPSDPMIKGYFQRDPDGTVHSPSLPRDNEQALAVEEGWQPSPSAKSKLAALEQTVGGLQPSWSEVVTSPKGGRNTRPSPSSLSKLQNFGSGRRSGRRAADVATNQNSLSVYNLNEQPVQQAYQQPTSQRGDVRVSPFVGKRQGGNLTLFREVQIEGQSTLQGFVVDLDALASAMQLRVLQTTQLEEVVHLSWDDQRPEGVWVFEHTLAPPFESVQLSVGLDRVPGVTGIEETLLRGVSAVMLLLLLGFGGAFAFAVRAELAYAQRRSDFVAAVSHELKTPLTSIRMYAEMLRDGMVPDPERQRVYHATITSESERLTRLISNVLELSRLEQSAPRAEPVAGELQPSVEEAVEMLRPHATANQVELSVDLPRLPAVLIERDALIQVVMNLVDNAIKFGGEGQVTLSAVERGKGVQLLIRDHGPGVPSRQLRHIFDPFYRGERELTRTTKGTGIGLALVRGLMNDMGGAVTARNHPEGGLEVALTIRLAPA